MSTPRVSVVMTTYNGARFLSEAIESILNQSLISLELIVVDDGSIDSSPSVIRSFCARDLRVRGIFLERNLGIPKAANYGLRAARGEYIARMDSDDMCHRDRLLKQVSHLDKHKEIQLLGCHFRAVDEEGFLCSDAYARKLKEPLPLSFGFVLFLNIAFSIHQLFVAVLVLFRGIPGNISTYGEDVDLYPTSCDFAGSRIRLTLEN